VLPEDRRPRGLHRAPASGDRGDGSQQGGGSQQDESAEARELRRPSKLLEQENEILRRTAACFARDVLLE